MITYFSQENQDKLGKIHIPHVSINIITFNELDVIGTDISTPILIVYSVCGYLMLAVDS